MASLLARGERVRVLYQGDPEPVKRSLLEARGRTPAGAVLEASAVPVGEPPALPREAAAGAQAILHVACDGSGGRENVALRALLQSYAATIGCVSGVALLDPGAAADRMRMHSAVRYRVHVPHAKLALLELSDLCAAIVPTFLHCKRRL